MIDPSKPDYANRPGLSRKRNFEYCLQDVHAPPAVTIATPFYNMGEIFLETAQSVFEQSFQQWEWLIINDGSQEEESLAILDRFRKSDPRIRVIDHETNKGLSAARNTGFREARTPYVVLLDGDDLLEPTAVEKWLWNLESYPEYSFVHGYSVGFGAMEYLWQRGFHNGSMSLDENQIDHTSLVRCNVHQAVGGFDETIVVGGEDWEFWLRCANSNYWGNTIPEYLNWYRRRPNHADRWVDLTKERLQLFHQRLRQRYPRLWEGRFPQIQLRWHMPNDQVPDTLPAANILRKQKRRLLMIVPHLTIGGADKFNLDLLQQLVGQGWEVTIATTLKGDHYWLPLFGQHSPDIFILHNFLRPVDHPRFLKYLIRSRQADVVMISNSELGYRLLPYLRASCPDVAFTDFGHAEHEDWNNGGYPRLAVDYQVLFDLSIVASEHLKRWMVKQGAEPTRIEVSYINVDPQEWKPDSAKRAAVREELGLPDVPVILYASRIHPDKQPRVFARTMLQLRDRMASFVALVAGDGPEMGWLRTFISAQRLGDHVRLLSAASIPRMKHLMAAADILFLPSKWEGIALSLYEAMACGLAVVAADVGGQRELVTPDCGVLLPRADEQTEVEQYTRALVELLGDAPKRAAMGRRARVRICERFTLEAMAHRIDELFERARQLNQSQPRETVGWGMANICATQVVEYLRLSETIDYLWLERERTRKQEKKLLYRLASKGHGLAETLDASLREKNVLPLPLRRLARRRQTLAHHK